MKKMPPIEKIPEAYSAIADGRVRMEGTAEAHIRSSGGEKEYTVRWDGDTFCSDDNASCWQGYPGYPVIAVLMLQGRLPLDRKIAALFSGVNWSVLNRKYRRDYAKAAAEVLAAIGADDGGTDAVHMEIKKVYEAVRWLDITLRHGTRRTQKQAGKEGSL
jgi:hypothetical protein